MAEKSTQEFVEIRDIRDGVAILKDGTLISVLLTSSLNFALKSTDEREAITLQYQNFLNSLDFSIQILIQSRRLNIQPYLNSLQDILAIQTNDLLKIQTKEYMGFIKSLSESVNIMDKSFFIVVPFRQNISIQPKGLASKITSIFKKETPDEAASKLDVSFKENKSQLDQRIAVIRQGVARLGVRTAPLGTEELIELFYKAYNPGETGAPAGVSSNR